MIASRRIEAAAHGRDSKRLEADAQSGEKRTLNPGISKIILGIVTPRPMQKNAKMLPHSGPTLDRFNLHRHKFLFTGAPLKRRSLPSHPSQDDRTPNEDCVPAEPTTQPNVQGMLEAAIAPR